MNSHRILELFSGIGGMHYAWKESQILGKIEAAIDINTVANSVYIHNFKETRVLNRNIQSLSSSFINSLNPNVILMSPPCQPFTRNGLQKHSDDSRSFSFTHLLSILKELTSVQYILLENVKGFEISDSRNSFIEMLKECGFFYREYLLSPHQFEVPNSRLRYYCIARKKPFCKITTSSEIVYEIPNCVSKSCYKIEDILDDKVDSSYYLSTKHLKKAALLDICYGDSERSCCFTKAYTHFLEGTGSVYTDETKETVHDVFEKCDRLDKTSEEYDNTIKTLKLRFFTPKEISHLMSFPTTFEFPDVISRKQCYRLLGNSINVKVVSELIKYMINGE